MKIVCVGVVLLCLSGSSDLPGQERKVARETALSAATGPLVVDVHRAPYRKSIVYTTNLSPGTASISPGTPDSSPGRFDMRHATVLDMIEFAYDLGEQDDDRENAAIVGGPTWIDLDRFDVAARVALAKASTSKGGSAGDANGVVRGVMKRVLAERFALKIHMENRPLPGFVVTVAKEGTKERAGLAEAKVSEAVGECRGEGDSTGGVLYTLTCTSETVGEFVAAVGGNFPHPVVDRTGLAKRYDFALKLVLGPEVRTRDDRARVYTAALLKQLGLVVAAGPVAQPAVVVDAVDRVPTANAAGIETQIPALANLEFEVASIRPAAETEPKSQIRASGSQITFSSFPLSELIVRAWQLPTAAMLGKALPLLPVTRFTMLVKLPPEIDGLAVSQDQDQVNSMLRKLLIDRFAVRYHWGEWTQPDAYVLAAGTPRMKKADTGSRSFCKFGPPEGERDARATPDSAFNAEFHCQDVTMAQFADLVQGVAGTDVKNRVPDRTGLAGAYDFTVFYTTGRMLRARTDAAAKEAKRSGGAAEPVDGVGVEDAFRRQLGLRLEKQALTMPALILDHFDQGPTEN